MKCLDSLRPLEGEWELILVANGHPLPEQILVKAQEMTPQFKLLSSESQLTPGRARNFALEHALGEWIFFLDDDAYIRQGYWERVRPLLQDNKIDVLGGPDSPALGMSAFSLALALALSSPFCTGTTFSRHRSFGTSLQHADEKKLTSANLWVRKKALGEVRFPEDFIRAEETVFLQKLKLQGRAFYYHPLLVVGHFRRSRLKDLWRPSFYAGFFRSKLMKEKLQKDNEIFWLPSGFVLMHGLFFLEPIVFWYLARMYLGLVLFMSLALSIRAKRVWLFPLVSFFHYFIVFLYGIGFLVERMRRLL